MGMSGATALEDGPSFEETIYHTFPASVRDTAPALRYLSLDLSPKGDMPWRYNFLDPEHGQELLVPPDLRWWRFEGVANARVVRPLDPVRGERIAAHLRSVRYDYSNPFSGSS